VYSSHSEIFKSLNSYFRKSRITIW